MAGGDEVLLDDRAWRRRNSMWLLPTVLCCGLLTWGCFLFVGVRAKRRSWLTAAAVYGVAVVAYFVLIETGPKAPDGTSDTSSWQGTVGSLFFLAVWFGGAVHALIINRQWLAFLAAPEETVSAPPTSGTASAPSFSRSVTNQLGALDDPWRSFVSQALTWQRDIETTVANTAPGPMQDRLRDLAGHVDNGMTECWKLARGGHQLTAARARIDTVAVTRQLSQLPPARTDPAMTQVAQALQAQLDTATRIEGEVSSTYDGLLVLNARLGEVSARVIELSARPLALGDAALVDSEVAVVVGQLAAIRQALTDLDGSPPAA